MSQVVTVDAADTSRLLYMGRWASGSDSYNRQMQWTNNDGDMVTLRFRGTSIRIYAGHPGGDFGSECWVVTGVTLDTEERQQVIWMCGQPDDTSAMKIYDRSGLEDKEHTVRLFYWASLAPLRFYSMEYDGAPITRTSPVLPVNPPSPSVTAPPPSATQSEPSPTTQRTVATTLPPTSDSTSTQPPSSSATQPGVTNRLDTSLVAAPITSEQSDTSQIEHPTVITRYNTQVHTRASDAPDSLGTDTVGGETSESNSPGSSTNRVPVIVGSILGALFVLAAAILITVCLMKRRNRRTGSNAEFEDKDDESGWTHMDPGATNSTTQLTNANLSASHFSADTTTNRSVDHIDSSNPSSLSSAFKQRIAAVRKGDPPGAPVSVPRHEDSPFMNSPVDSAADVETSSRHSTRMPPPYQSGNFLVA